MTWCVFVSLWFGKMTGDNVQIILVAWGPSIFAYKGVKRWKENDKPNNANNPTV